MYRAAVQPDTLRYTVATYSPPGYSSADLAATAIISFGVGMAARSRLSSGGCCGWGWGYGGWGTSWHGGTVMYQRNVYVSRTARCVTAGGYRGGYYGRRARYAG